MMKFLKALGVIWLVVLIIALLAVVMTVLSNQAPLLLGFIVFFGFTCFVAWVAT